MANYKVTDTELTSVANAIRTKGGTQAQLEWPAGFVSAVEALPSGGGGANVLPGAVELTPYASDLATGYVSSGNWIAYTGSYTGGRSDVFKLERADGASRDLFVFTPYSGNRFRITAVDTDITQLPADTPATISGTPPKLPTGYSVQDCDNNKTAMIGWVIRIVGIQTEKYLIVQKTNESDNVKLYCIDLGGVK